MPNLSSLVIEGKIPRNKDSTYPQKRHALEDWLDGLLRKYELGEKGTNCHILCRCDARDAR